ncbi:TetR family transcriptional regulator [Allostella vacuolata]|nr:TetR family transcriptional regulator [Stella vacuolata]
MTDAPPDLRADARRNRERILQAAVGQFTRHGIDASLEDVARAAGVGAGTLYRHFPSREALIAAALRQGQDRLLAEAARARALPDADAALAAWLASLQDYLRTFHGLPAPVLAAIEQQDSPLALSCEAMAAMTGEFLDRAKREGHARASVETADLFLATLGIAWAVDRAAACGTSTGRVNAILARGYLRDGGDR